jgi:hypothetical protein
MTDRDRRDRDDWASQVPWHYGRRGPYEDWGWERGDSVLPEFRDPSVHEHQPPDRAGYSRDAGQRNTMRHSRSGGSMEFQRRGVMHNPYDDDMDYERQRWSRDYGRSYGRDSEYDRMGSSQGSYGGMYNRDYEFNRGGMGRGGYSRDYDYDRGQGSYGGMYNRNADYNRGASNREYDYDRGGMNQGSMYNREPATWTYTEYWLIPGPYTGRGPQGYQRSDERIKEDVCERLTQHGQIDASNIEIDVENGEVILRGSVDQRHAKRMAEDAAESVSGVRDVRNELRVKQDQGVSGQQSSQNSWSSQGSRGMSGSEGAQGMSSQSGTQQRAVGEQENRS